MANDYTDWKKLTDLFILLNKPIPWDPPLRFIRDFGEILTKEQHQKLAGLSARYQALAIKIRNEHDAKMSEISEQAAVDVQKTMGGPMK